jgi:hypothetical protein
MITKRNLVVYVSGSYTAPTMRGIEENIIIAREYAIRIWDLGYSVICPHLNTAEFENDCKNTTYEDFIQGDLEIIARCDTVFMMASWVKSMGANREREQAFKIGKPVFNSFKELEKWGNEKTRQT